MTNERVAGAVPHRRPDTFVLGFGSYGKRPDICNGITVFCNADVGVDEISAVWMEHLLGEIGWVVRGGGEMRSDDLALNFF